jgi:hypothetical protein
MQVKRELMANYTLVELTKDRITQLGGAPLPAAAKVIYFASDKATIALPTPRAPIVQSYIDVTMGGAIELQVRLRPKFHSPHWHISIWRVIFTIKVNIIARFLTTD